MMDTDKKRKTIRCQKCGLTFSGERVYCPLCKKRIIAEGTADSSIKEDFDVFPVTQKKQADFIFMKIVTFAALAAVIVAGMVDRMMVLSDRTWQPIFFLVVIGVAGGYALLIVGQRKWKNIRKMVMYEVIIGMILCIAYDWYTGFFLRRSKKETARTGFSAKGVVYWLEGLERTDCSSAYGSWHEFIIFYSWICGQKAPDRLWNLFFADYYSNSSCCNTCLCWSYA